jgi:predicted DNA-binding transcriptional regulator AlpA
MARRPPPKPGPAVEPVLDLMSAAAVARRLAITTRTLYRLVEAGLVPAPIRFSRKLVRWRAADIERCLEQLQRPVPPGPAAGAAS